MINGAVIESKANFLLSLRRQPTSHWDSSQGGEGEVVIDRILVGSRDEGPASKCRRIFRFTPDRAYSYQHTPWQDVTWNEMCGITIAVSERNVN